VSLFQSYCARLTPSIPPVLFPLQSGKRQGDEGVGRAIAEALSSVPQLSPDAFEASFQGGLQDLLMVTYLTSLMQAQMRLAERVLGQVRAQ
jgi:hypothetical protein